MTVLADTWRLFVRHQRYTMRQPVFALINLVYPLFWLLLFGQLFEGLSRLSGFPTRSYLSFLAPGVVVMTVIYGSAFSALGLVMDFRSGVIDRYLSTPVSRAAIVLARVLDGSVGVTIQALLVLLLSIALGVRLATGPAGVLVILAAAFLLAAIFAAFASWIALSTRDEQSLVGTIQFLAMPLVFLSSVLLPVALMPGWLAQVVPYNPVEWATRAARSLVLSGWDVSLLLRSFGPLLALAAALTALSIVTFRRGAL